jgi:hypothetical protein
MSELTLKEKLERASARIALAFADFNEPAPVEQEVEAYTGKLSTGEDIKASPSITEGATVVLVSAEGELPLPDGSYTTEDGVSFTVTSGAVASVTTPEPAPSPEAVAMSEQLETLKADNVKLSETIEANKKAFELKFAEIETKLTKHIEFANVLQEVFVNLSETPIVEPTQAPKGAAVELSSGDWRKEAQNKLKQAKLTK